MAEDLPTTASPTNETDSPDGNSGGKRTLLILLQDEFAAELADTSIDYRSNPKMQEIFQLFRTNPAPFAIIKKAKDAHVPEPMVRRYMYDAISSLLEKGQYKNAATLVKNAKIGSPEFQATFAQLSAILAIDFAMQQERKALEKLTLSKRPKRKYLLLSHRATVADFFREMNSAEVDEEVKDAFWTGMNDWEQGFREFASKLINLRNTPAANTTLFLTVFNDDPDNISDIYEQLHIHWIEDAEEEPSHLS